MSAHPPPPRSPEEFDQCRRQCRSDTKKTTEKLEELRLSTFPAAVTIAIGRSTPQAKRKKASQASETDEQWEVRLETARVRNAQACSSETAEQQEARLETVRVHTARSRQTLHADLNLGTFHYDASYDYILHPNNLQSFHIIVPVQYKQKCHWRMILMMHIRMANHKRQTGHWLLVRDNKRYSQIFQHATERHGMTLHDHSGLMILLLLFHVIHNRKKCKLTWTALRARPFTTSLQLKCCNEQQHHEKPPVSMTQVRILQAVAGSSSALARGSAEANLHVRWAVSQQRSPASAARRFSVGGWLATPRSAESTIILALPRRHLAPSRGRHKKCDHCGYVVNPGLNHSEFSYVKIMLDNVFGWQVFSRISHSHSPPFIPALLHTLFKYPHIFTHSLEVDYAAQQRGRFAVITQFDLVEQAIDQRAVGIKLNIL
ncbi:hypothetical protein PR048_006331 [Dryococelus australis]|uniref:Uncharacterized protein n=1 Tax=Dryococelus australis TaxID=614101 RepID=A0ABQ9IAR3_9NEOP|nr:hypothetical protein PR048_006331 [Dryococelus australis]